MTVLLLFLIANLYNMLDQQTLQELKDKLLAEKERLESDLQKIAVKERDEYTPSVEDIGRSMEDAAEEYEEYTTKAGITGTLDKNLKEVIEALERMEKGTFGKCANCDKDIPLDRLRAYPSAKHCLDCAK
jgi:DnaK suppressor protein